MTLLILPLLTALTTNSPEAWKESQRLRMGDPVSFLNSFARRASRAGTPLQPEQKAELGRIIQEEYERAEKSWDPGVAENAIAASHRTERERCYAEIVRRARPVLDNRQVSQLQSFQRRGRNQSPSLEPGWGRTTPFYRCLIDIYFFILLPLHCVWVCGAVIRDELEANTLSFLTTRPLSRTRLLLVKFLSGTAWLQLWLAVQTGLLFAAGAFRQVPDLWELLPAFLAIQVLAVWAWSALGLLLGQVSRRYMALALLYGSMIEMGIGRIPTNIHSLSLMRHLKALLSHSPELQGIFNWPTAGPTQPIIAIVLGSILFLSVAALLFNFREYHHTTEMQK